MFQIYPMSLYSDISPIKFNRTFSQVSLHKVAAIKFMAAAIDQIKEPRPYQARFSFLKQTRLATNQIESERLLSSCTRC